MVYFRTLSPRQEPAASALENNDSLLMLSHEQAGRASSGQELLDTSNGAIVDVRRRTRVRTTWPTVELAGYPDVYERLMRSQCVCIDVLGLLGIHADVCRIMNLMEVDAASETAEIVHANGTHRQ